MTEEEAKDHIALVLGDVATQLTPADYPHVLARSLTFDPAGLKPGEPGYVTTYDGDWAAAEAATLLAVRGMASGGIVRFTSEGATFEKRSPDLFGLARMLRSRSPLSKLAGSMLGVIEVDGRLSDYRPTRYPLADAEPWSEWA